MIQIGSLVDGKYKILSLIGNGGMSNVYLAINEKVNKTWAIKEVRKVEDNHFEVIRQSLIVEMELLKKITHPNLPRIIDVIEEDEDILIVMDYIEGITLEKVLEENKCLSQSDVVDWALQLCEVLEYLHRQSPPIIYRDMKPANIMLQSDGKVILIDFGTAREYKKDKIEDTTCLGTRGYAAPEQFGGMGQTDERTDIYNLGATLYHLLTGHNPGKPPYEMYPIRYWDNNLSSGLEYIIQKCTSNNPEERYQSISELKYALQNYRKLDESAILKYKKYLCIFLSFLVATFLCLCSSIFLWTMANNQKNKEYYSILNQAQKVPDIQLRLDKFLEAIRMNPGEKDAYNMLYETMIEDGIMQDEEEQRILRLCTSINKELEEFEKKNPKAYADFCYNCGNAYWYYYEHQEGRQTRAVTWFETALSYYEKEEERKVEYRRSQLFVQIGNFYKKIVASQINGNDAGMYATYWNALVELKKMNDQESDRDYITLYMYEEIIARSMEYAKYLREDGICKEELMQIYQEISSDIAEKKKDASASLVQRIEVIEDLLSHADDFVTSSYAMTNAKR